jgi:hypothetical protein
MMKMHDLQPIKNVTARAVLVKDTAVFCSEGHIEKEWEIEPDGTRVPAAHWVSDDDDEELFRQDNRSPFEIIQACEWICRQLLKEGRRFLHYELTPGHERVVNLQDLAVDCDGWEEEEFEVNEQK